MSWAEVGPGAKTRAASAAAPARRRQVLTRVFAASSIEADRAYNGRGDDEKYQAQSHHRRGIRRRARGARGMPEPARRQGRTKRSHRAGAALRSRSAVAQAPAQPLAVRLDDRRVGRRGGQRLDHPSRRRRAARQRKGTRTESADRRVLPHGAADTRVRSGRQPGALLGRPGPGLRVAGRRTRRARRLQGQRLGRRQRQGRLPYPEVHQGREIPHAARPLRQERRQQRPGELRARGEDLGRSRIPTRPTSPTAISTSASPWSTPTPAR